MRILKRALQCAALCLIVLALCQPHFRKKEILVEKKGIEIIIAVDVSQSMLAKDIPPSRLEKAKLELSSLIDRFRQDKIGIVVFAGEAFIQCPLTLDKGAIKLFLSTVSPTLVQLQGTSLSKAIEVASEAFSKESKDNKVIILLTDGEDHEGAAVEAAKKVKKEGVHIFTVGIGTPEGRTIPDEFGNQGVKKDRAGRVIISKLNEDILKQIAKESSGMYYRSSRGDLEVMAMESAVRRMTQSSFSKDKTYEYEENYQFILLIALIMLMLEMIFSERKWRRE